MKQHRKQKCINDTDGDKHYALDIGYQIGRFLLIHGSLSSTISLNLVQKCKGYATIRECKKS